MMIAAIHDSAEDGGVHGVIFGECGAMEIARCVSGVLQAIEEVAEKSGIGMEALISMAALVRSITGKGDVQYSECEKVPRDGKPDLKIVH